MKKIIIPIREMLIEIPATRKTVEEIILGRSFKKIYKKLIKFQEKIDMKRGYCNL